MGHWETLEIRVGATDIPSSAKMRIYYSSIAPFSRAIRHAMIRHISKQQGDIFAEEATRTLPGDSIIETPAGSATHGITIDAPAEAIWPMAGSEWAICAVAGTAMIGWIMPEYRVHLEFCQNGNVYKQAIYWPLLLMPKMASLLWILTTPRMLLLGASIDLDSGQTIPSVTKQLPENYWRPTWVFVLQAKHEVLRGWSCGRGRIVGQE